MSILRSYGHSLSNNPPPNGGAKFDLMNWLFAVTITFAFSKKPMNLVKLAGESKLFICICKIIYYERSERSSGMKAVIRSRSIVR